MFVDTYFFYIVRATNGLTLAGQPFKYDDIITYVFIELSRL